MTEAITIETATTQEEFELAFASRGKVQEAEVEEAVVVTPEEKTEEDTETDLALTEVKVEDGEVVAEEGEEEEVDPAVLKTEKTKTRIQKLAEAKVAAEARAAQLEAELATFKKAPPEIPVDKPTRGQFTDVDEYIAASIAYEVNQAMGKTTQQQVQLAAFQKFEARTKEFTATTADFDAVIAEAVAEVRSGARDAWSPEITSTLQESDVGPAMQYYLAQNPEEVTRINGLQPNRRLIEMGKLEDKFSKPVVAAVKPPPKASKAPPPIKTVAGSAPTSKTLDNVDNQDDFERLYKQKYGTR